MKESLSKKGFLILDSGESFSGQWLGGEDRAGEVVFNTSHSGYEEMATDPSYFKQILVLTAPMQGNYGQSEQVWESRKIWIEGFVCLQMQNSKRDSGWVETLRKHQIPIMDEVDTRKLTVRLRQGGTAWGALVQTESVEEAHRRGQELIQEARPKTQDWVSLVSRTIPEAYEGMNPRGPRLAMLDFGSKENILREILQRSREVKVFPVTSDSSDVKNWNPDGIVLSNGPGDPAAATKALRLVKDLLGWKPMFGICMGHQILSLALGAKTYKLQFGHRGGNHPIQDQILNRIYMTSQNHGYAVDSESLPTGVEVTHTNLNDHTVSGIRSIEMKCFSVQFHPESHPGPNEAVTLFDYFISQTI